MNSQDSYAEFGRTLERMSRAIVQAAVAISDTAAGIHRSAEAIAPMIDTAMRRSPEGIIPFPKIAPLPCLGCRDYLGFINERNERLICGKHPFGSEERDCKDFICAIGRAEDVDKVED